MRIFAIAILFSITAAAQVAAPARNSAPPPATTTMAAMGGTMGATLPQLQQTIENLRVDLAKLRVDKWKTDSAVKQQAASNVQSLDRNMTGAMPAMISAVQTNPNSVAAAFRLYRNLNALYDVLANVTETAGAFGGKEEYAALAQDTGNLDQVRRTLADVVENMAAQRDAAFVTLQQRAAQAQQAPAQPKKIIVDDNAPVKKKSTKKKKVSTPK